MKKLNRYIQEKYLIDTNFNDDEWVLTEGPAWSNYDHKEVDEIRKVFPDRYFDVYTKWGTWIQVMLIKLSELETAQKLLGFRNKPVAYELPEPLSINATDKEIKKFISNHHRKYSKKWLYDDLKRIA